MFCSSLNNNGFYKGLCCIKNKIMSYQIKGCKSCNTISYELVFILPSLYDLFILYFSMICFHTSDFSFRSRLRGFRRY